MSKTNEVGRPGKTHSWLFNYFGAGLIWGSSFFFIEFANTSLPPIGVAFWRCLFGALTLLLIIIWRKINLRRDGKMLALSFIVGLFN
ncbi:MAG: DMT family transporter, partial [Actinomycetes bacterium]